MPKPGRLADYMQAADELGLVMDPWQIVAATYITATKPDGAWLYREVCTVVARQNGKTTLLQPRVLMSLKAGESVLHTAQDRKQPRDMFDDLVERIQANAELRKLVQKIRSANGTEVIKFWGGGEYTLVAPGHGIRGHHSDLAIEDELREQKDDVVKKAMGGTLAASANPQRLYASNAGEEDSIILNEIRERRDERPSLCYLEWSAAPERALDDRLGWAEANPSLGGRMSLGYLENEFDGYRANPAGWETEHLCRSVITMQPRLVDVDVWMRGNVAVEVSRRPMLGIAMDPSGIRASAATAWQQADGSIGVQVVAEVNGDPIDVGLYGKDLSKLAMKLGAANVGYSALTDAELAKHFRKVKSIDGREYANASENFARLVNAGMIHWQDADQITADLAWTAQKTHDGGTWHAVKAKDDHPVTAVLAAIRAVWLVSGPQLSAPRFL